MSGKFIKIKNYTIRAVLSGSVQVRETDMSKLLLI